jgi:hypothetical protein
MKRLFFIMMLLTPLSTWAATYSWTDASGTINFTDDLGAVPAKYRKKALQKAAGEEMVPEAKPPAAAAETKTTPPAPAKPGTPAAAPAAVAKPDAPTAPADSKVTAATRFGERTAGEWQAEFRNLRGQIKEIEQQVETLKREGGDGKTMLTSSKIAELNARNKQLNQEYEALRLRFNALVEQANKVGLPSEFGQ